MGVNFGSYMLGNGSLVQSQIPLRAVIQWARIQDKPVDVEFVKPGVLSKNAPPGTKPVDVVLPTQTVRIEYESRASIARGVAGAAPMLTATIFGIHGHPEIDDSDIEEGYTFEWEGDHFRITDVIRVNGGIQAIAVVNG